RGPPVITAMAVDVNHQISLNRGTSWTITGYAATPPRLSRFGRSVRRADLAEQAERHRPGPEPGREQQGRGEHRLQHDLHVRSLARNGGADDRDRRAHLPVAGPQPGVRVAIQVRRLPAQRGRSGAV